MAFESAPGVHLARTADSVAEIEALVDLVGGRSGLTGVLGDLNRQGRNARVPGLAVDHGFAWDAADNGTRRWWPQGISSTADADDQDHDEQPWDRRSVLVVSWYARDVDDTNQGSRLTFVDLQSLRYRHVLLVVPVLKGDRVDLAPLGVHAGGIVWRGPYLHVAGTSRGIFTCRLDDILRVPDVRHDPDRGALGRRGDRLATFGYRHILPVRFRYRAGADPGITPLRYSFLSLSRPGSGAVLAAGEYGLRDQTTRLLGFALDDQQLLSTDQDGLARPALPTGHGPSSMQGAVLVDDTWYITASRTPYGLGALYVGRPGAFRNHRMALPFGPEDITYWPARDALWSVTEHPHRRWVYAMNRKQFH